MKICEQSFKIPDCLKVVHDSLIQPGGWVSVNLDESVSVQGESECDLNLHTDIKFVKPVESDEIPNFVEMSFDGEMVSPSFEFPRAEKLYDIVAMLALNFRKRNDKEPYNETLICLGHMDPIEGVDVICVQNEYDLFVTLHKLIHQHKPDIWTGYNIIKFDIPYLMRRAKKLKLPNSFFVWGRVYNEASELTISSKSKEKFGKNVSADHKKVQYNVVKIPGSRIEDALPAVKGQMKKLTSYKLENVANFYLGEGKHPVEPEDIFCAYQDITDNLQSRDNIGQLHHFLTEVRVMVAFDCVTRKKNLADEKNTQHFPNKEAHSFFAEKYVLQTVSGMWPKEFSERIEKVLQNVFRVLNISHETFGECKAYSYETCEDVLRSYIEMRSKGTTLMFGLTFISMVDEWFVKGISLSQIPNSKDGDASSILNKILQSPSKVYKKTKREREEDNNGVDFENTSRENGLFQEGLKKWERRIDAEIENTNYTINNNCTQLRCL